MGWHEVLECLTYCGRQPAFSDSTLYTPAAPLTASRPVNAETQTADVLARRQADPSAMSPQELRVAIIGNVDSGKSTMVGKQPALTCTGAEGLPVCWARTAISPILQLATPVPSLIAGIGWHCPHSRILPVQLGEGSLASLQLARLLVASAQSQTPLRLL